MLVYVPNSISRSFSEPRDVRDFNVGQQNYYYPHMSLCDKEIHCKLKQFTILHLFDIY